MRSVVMTSMVAFWLAAPTGLAVAAQDPAPDAGAVRRAERIRAQESESPRTQDAGSDERRGRVRAPTAHRTEASRTSDEPSRPSTAVASADASGADAEEQRRGAVRRPPSGPRGESAGGTRDRAVPRTSTSAPPRDRGRDRLYVYPYYPSRYRGYYDPYYNPWAYSGFGLGYYYSPWGWGPGYAQGYYGSRGYGDIGSVRLKVSPRDAEVFVDNYFAGYVDDFDGIFQSLKLEVGGHRIEIRKPGFAPLQFDVHVHPDRTVTVRGELRPPVP